MEKYATRYRWDDLATKYPKDLRINVTSIVHYACLFCHGSRRSVVSVRSTLRFSSPNIHSFIRLFICVCLFI